MFAPSSVHVLGFDPRHGADTARQYAGKYASTACRTVYAPSSLGLTPPFSPPFVFPSATRCVVYSMQRKPEKWYYLETASNGLKDFLKRLGAIRAT